MRNKLFTLLIISMACAVGNASAQSAEAIDSFIEEVKTVTYDCPDPTNFDQLETYLSSSSLNARQTLALSVEKSHFLMCDGKANEAQALLFDLVGRDGIDKSSYFYASAIYQIGFAYDLKEQPQRCEYYEQAQSLSQDKFSDIYLSATLGIITNCRSDLAVGERLGMMFNVLELYSKTDNYQALAHIHNSIGLVYGGLQQHVLAAEQYLKAHEMGLKVYTGSNQLTILISAISSLFASGQYDRAYEAIMEFDSINQHVGTPLTNYFYYFSLTGYYYRVGDMENMKRSLPDLMASVEQLSNPVYTAMAKWYQVVPCISDRDIDCVNAYLAEASQQSPSVQRFLAHNLDYLKLQVDIGLVLNDLEKTQAAFAQYSERASANTKRSQSSASILGVASLYSKIYSLESEIEQAKQLKSNIILIGVGAFLIFVALTIYYLRKKHIEKLAYDPTTGLLNAEVAITRIEQLSAPDSGKANALALLDLSNFRELNVAAGLNKGNVVLQEISKTLQKITRDTDLLGRYGPEQFILCLPNIEENSAKTFFERLQNELDNTRVGQPSQESINVRSSMSIFISTERLTDMQNVLNEMLMAINVRANQ
ncbi:GGDEF domain-containing protein [Alteromonas facilis]|uniref:GGDEF domain-containing protein n=1 Tax=Alteromonas facilis TaxID=2048004 RepID=UPI000C28DA52|nr:GGDEF domain-containing protein [Alteromonas facilis]